MKRRKKLWIICAALAVVGLCTVALMTRPRQFAFLRGATVESVDIESSAHGPPGVWVITGYQRDCTITEFIEGAREELKLDEGWRWPDEPLFFRRAGDGPIVENPGEQTSVWFGQPTGSTVPPLEWKEPVEVQVMRPATPFERLLYWAGMRTR